MNDWCTKPWNQEDLEKSRVQFFLFAGFPRRASLHKKSRGGGKTRPFTFLPAACSRATVTPGRRCAPGRKHPLEHGERTRACGGRRQGSVR